MLGRYMLGYAQRWRLFALVQMMWKASLERCACHMDDKFDLSSLCVLSEGYSAAAIDQVTPARHT